MLPQDGISFMGGRTLMARGRRRITSLTIALAVVAAGGTTALLAGIGPAGAFTPGEGLGASWCARYDGTSLGSYRDVYACQSSSKAAGKTPFDSFAGFQPTELANRFLYAITGHTLFDNDVAGNFSNWGTQLYYPNDPTKYGALAGTASRAVSATTRIG